MAVTLVSQSVHYSASIADSEGHRKTVVAYSNPADLSGVLTGLAAWLTALDAIISGVIVASEIRVTPAITGAGTTGRSGFADSDVSELGGFEFALSGTQKHYSQEVPAFADALKTTKGAPVITDTAVAAYTAVMLGTAAAYTEPLGVATLASLFGTFKGEHRVKGLKGSSFTTS